MPNYILSRTSPPAHIYERNINLGYGVKVDTSDAPKPNEGKNMNDAKEVLVVVNDPSTVAVISADEVAGNAGATPAPASDTPEVKDKKVLYENFEGLD